MLRPDGDRYQRCPAWTVEQVQEKARAVYPRSIAHCDRWIAHYDNRLAYERAMLAEQIGTEATANPLADRFAFAVGGQVRTRRSDEWLTVLKVNKGANGSVSSVATTAPTGSKAKRAQWRVESISDYREPSAENVAAAKAAAKLPPICNYPGEGFREMTEAEWKGRRQSSDFPYIGKVKETETHGEHRVRQMPMPGEFWKKQQVFITDAKRVDPPKLAPPSEPAEPAEFLAEFVAPPAADLDAALALVSEIMAEPAPAEAAAVPAPAPEIASEPRRRLGSAKEEAERAGAEIITGLGQFRVGRGHHVTEWCNDEPTAWRSFCEIAGIPFEADAVPVDLQPARAIALPDTTDLPSPSPTADFEAMRAMLRGGGVQVVVAPQLFQTSHELAADVAEAADIRPGQRILEPSAGTGALIEAARNCADDLEVVAVEINAKLSEHLRAAFPGAFVHCGDFLDFDPPAERFDVVLMNPPFENGADIKHITHGRRFLKPGGRLVAICADGPRQRARLEPIAIEYRPLPSGSFKAAGTMVNTALVVIEGPPE
ncbi:methyltransferase domain-containing protein [Bradyrhizobium cenepequi]